MCGDRYSIFSSLDFQGLIAVATTLNHRKVVSKIKKLINQNTNFFQYILKIVPIDYVCQTNIRTIKAIIQKHYKEYINNHESFMIELNRRKNEIIERDILIESIAKVIENEVNLENPDKIVRIEVLGKFTGISFLKPYDIIKARNTRTNPS